jgi:hypothetical protein
MHIEITWRRGVTFRVALPVVVPEDKRDLVEAELRDLNGDIRGAFELGPPPAYEISVPSDEDGKVETRGFEEALYEARTCPDIGRATLEPILAPKPSLPKPLPGTPGSEALALSGDERQRARAICEANYRVFAHRLDGPLFAYLRTQRWWKHHRIVEIQSAAPMPAEGVAFGFGPNGDVCVLRAHVENLQNIIRVDPPTEPITTQEARAYAMFCNGLTTDARWGELTVDSFDDIPLRTLLAPDERAAIEELRDKHAARMHPPALDESSEGFSLRLWVVSMSRLIEREIRSQSRPERHGRSWGTASFP